MQSLRKAMDQVHHVLKTENIVNIALRMLACINRETVLHSVRTAYLSYKIASEHPMNEHCTMQNLVLLALFHTIGFFREDIHFNYIPHQNNPDFFSEDKSTKSKYIFSCYYLDYMTPLHNDAHCLQYFLLPPNQDIRDFVPQEEYKEIIYLAARISAWWSKHKDEELPKDINEIAPGYFDPQYVQAFYRANKNNCLMEAIKANTHQDELTQYLSTISYPTEEKRFLEKMIVHLLDFKSTSTMKHSINTSCVALSLGLRLQLNDDDMTTLFTSAFLHDIGKIATPQQILENPGKLSPEEMGIMRHHVNHSKRILTGHVSDEILETVYRHHEKLNGKGYPRKVEGKDLTLLQRILTVADITSALNDSRSYKGEFSKDKTISIIQKMTDKGEIDGTITRFIIEDFDTILQEQQIFQNMLQVDFSNVISNYNDYIYEDIDLWVENLLETAMPYNQQQNDGLEELDDLEDLDELEELEEL